MPRRISPLQEDRTMGGEGMFVGTEAGSMRRGQRKAPRTEVCRPCLVWPEGARDQAMEAVVLDLNPHGMRLRMIDPLDVGAPVVVQMMRDDEFRHPLSHPIHTRVVRVQDSPDGFVDHGIQVVPKEIKRIKEVRPVEFPRRRPMRRVTPRMHPVDLARAERNPRRTGER